MMRDDSTTGYVPRTCEHCGIGFHVRERFSKGTHGRFCSRQCAGLARTAATRVARVCQGCGTTFYRNPFRDDVYCSTKCANTARRVPVLERFWAKVNKTPTCWLWTGGTSAGGYGKFNVGSGKYVDAHRYAWEQECGPIPEGMEVCHDCPDGDNPLCVRPSHMFLGTRGENIRDAVKKGRWRNKGAATERTAERRPAAIGERHYCAKVNEAQVLEMRADWDARRATQPEMAAHYGISQASVNDIVLRKTWRHLPEP